MGWPSLQGSEGGSRSTVHVSSGQNAKGFIKSHRKICVLAPAVKLDIIINGYVVKYVVRNVCTNK